MIRCLRLIRFCTCVLFNLLPFLASAAEPAPSKVHKTLTDVPYGPHPRNVLDVWQVASDKPTPVLIYFHGGGFVGGDKVEARRLPIGPQCRENGITVVTANYRFLQKAKDGRPAVTYTACLEDAQRVVQFVRSRAKDWNIDPARVAASGASAGAIMSLWVALRDDIANPASPDPVARLSSRVQAAVPYAGPTTLDPDEILRHVGGPPSIHSSLPPFYGVESVDDIREPEFRAAVRDASPITHVSPDDPPLYLIYPTVLAEKPLPAIMPSGISIHHANFGRLLRAECDKRQVRCLFKYTGSGQQTREVDFLQEIFAAD